MTSDGRNVPGCVGALWIALATLSVVMLRTIASCLADTTFGRPTLVGCIQQHTDGAVLGGGAAALALLILGAAVLGRFRPAKNASTVRPEDVSVVEFAERWADEHEQYERLVTADPSQETDMFLAEGRGYVRYIQLARAVGVTMPRRDADPEATTSASSVRSTRALLAGVLAVAGIWIAWNPATCAIAQSSLEQCLRDPGRIDWLLGGVGVLSAAGYLALRTPPIWMGDAPAEGLSPTAWIANEWQRLVALGREPTGADHQRRGAWIAETVSEYMQLARAVPFSAPTWIATGKMVSLDHTNPLDVAAAFGEQMAQHADSGGYHIRSERALLYPRRVIRAALYVMLTATRNEKRRASVGPVLTDLAEYVADAELEPYKDAIAAADAFMKHTFQLGQRGNTTPEFLEQSMKLIERYDAKRLAPIEDLVVRRQADDLAELERRFGELVGHGSASKLWFMGSLERVVRCAEAIEERKQSQTLDSLFGDQRPEAVGTVVRIFGSKELQAEIEAVQKYQGRPEAREQLDLYRGLLERLDQAQADQVSTILLGDRTAFQAAEAAFRNYLDLLRKMENTSINAELRAMGLGTRVQSQ